MRRAERAYDNRQECERQNSDEQPKMIPQRPYAYQTEHPTRLPSVQRKAVIDGRGAEERGERQDTVHRVANRSQMGTFGSTWSNLAVQDNRKNASRKDGLCRFDERE